MAYRQIDDVSLNMEIPRLKEEIEKLHCILHDVQRVLYFLHNDIDYDENNEGFTRASRAIMPMIETINKTLCPK